MKKAPFTPVACFPLHDVFLVHSGALPAARGTEEPAGAPQAGRQRPRGRQAHRPPHPPLVVSRGRKFRGAAPQNRSKHEVLRTEGPNLAKVVATMLGG